MKPIWVGTMVLTFPIGLVLSHVLVAAAYYLVLTPAALVLRLFRRDPLARAWEPEATSYWVRRAPAPDPSRYFRQF